MSTMNSNIKIFYCVIVIARIMHIKRQVLDWQEFNDSDPLSPLSGFSVVLSFSDLFSNKLKFSSCWPQNFCETTYWNGLKFMVSLINLNDIASRTVYIPFSSSCSIVRLWLSFCRPQGKENSVVIAGNPASALHETLNKSSGLTV